MGVNPLALAPHSRAVRPFGAHVAVFEKLLPLGSAALSQGLHVVDDFQQVAALGAAVNDLVERVLARATGDAAKMGAVGKHVLNLAPSSADFDHGLFATL